MRNRTNAPRADASPSVLNALSILESFDGQHASQSLSDLSRRLDIAKASVLRNLAALEHHGYVKRDPDTGRYSLGVQVLRLARQFSEQNQLLSIGAAHTAELARVTGETAHLSVLVGRDIVYSDVSEGSQHVRAVVSRGDRLPAHCVASGKVILAHVEHHQLTEFLTGGLRPLTPRTITTADDFIAEMEEVRRLGYGTSVGEWLDDVSAVAAPVFSHQDKVVGAIGIAGPRLRLGTRLLTHLASAVMLQAERLSRDLGASDRHSKPPQAPRPVAVRQGNRQAKPQKARATGARQ